MRIIFGKMPDSPTKTTENGNVFNCFCIYPTAACAKWQRGQIVGMDLKENRFLYQNQAGEIFTFIRKNPIYGGYNQWHKKFSL